MKDLIESIKARSCEAISSISHDQVQQAASILIDCLDDGKKIMIAGNGGSAADAQHMAAELVGRFKMERPALAAISLSTDTSILTALANDYGHEVMFSRQVEALGREGDALLVITTSGVSKNILKAVEIAHHKKMRTIGLTGINGGHLWGKCECVLTVESDETPRIQEAHSTIVHMLCEIVEERLFGQ